MIYKSHVQKGRAKGYLFVEYEDKESAEKAVDESGRANILGRKLTINYKMTKPKAPQEDRDCWFCYNNPNIERHMLFAENQHFYAALAKGPVTDEHFLIVPKAHTAH